MADNTTPEGRAENARQYQRLALTPEWWTAHLKRIEDMDNCKHEWATLDGIEYCRHCGLLAEITGDNEDQNTQKQR